MLPSEPQATLNYYQDAGRIQYETAHGEFNVNRSSNPNPESAEAIAVLVEYFDGAFDVRREVDMMLEGAGFDKVGEDAGRAIFVMGQRVVDYSTARMFFE